MTRRMRFEKCVLDLDHAFGHGQGGIEADDVVEVSGKLFALTP